MSKLFGVDGIRGAIDKYPLTEKDAECIGRSIAGWARVGEVKPTMLVATDTRESNARLKTNIVHGLSQGGVKIIDGGILPTAAVSYLIASKGLFSGGIMVTASHGPVNENGIKVFNQIGIKISENDENLIEKGFCQELSIPFETHPSAVLEEPDYARQYAYALAREYRSQIIFRLPTILDCANGSCYQVGPHIFNMLKIPYHLFNAFPDGTNINRRSGSEYARNSPRKFVEELKSYQSNLIIALDGDGDRVVFIDREAILHDGDSTMAILALSLQKKGLLRKDTVIGTPMSNSGLEHYLHQRQIHFRRVSNGDKYVTEALVQKNLCLGGEQIGHIVLHTDNTRLTGDGLRTALAILAELSQNPTATLSELAPGLRKRPQVKASVYLGKRVSIPAEKIPGLNELLDKTRLEIPDLINDIKCRPASTEPVYRIVLEALETSTADLATHASRLAHHIQKYTGYQGQNIEILDCCNGGIIQPKVEEVF